MEGRLGNISGSRDSCLAVLFQLSLAGSAKDVVVCLEMSASQENMCFAGLCVLRRSAETASWLGFRAGGNTQGYASDFFVCRLERYCMRGRRPLYGNPNECSRLGAPTPRCGASAAA